VKRWLAVAVLLVMAACTEEFTSPGVCPQFCPGGSIQVRDTVLSIIERDSAFAGYTPRYQGGGMAAAELPSVRSRPYFTFPTIPTRLKPIGTDTTTVPISVDSSRLRLAIVRRERSATNLELKLYQIPRTSDSTSDFASLDTYFNAAAIDSVNVSDLLSRPPITDTATIHIWGDTIQTDSAGHVLVVAGTDSVLLVYFSLDTLKVPFSVPDSGQFGLGVRISADSNASLSLGANESVSNGPVLKWFYHYTVPDSAATVKHDSTTRSPRFDSFVFDPPTPALDSNLAVGSAPSERSLLRFAIPAFLRDSFDVVRATLNLVPVAPFAGAASDSLQILARPIVSDFGGKSTLSGTTGLFGHVTLHPGTTDTVTMEITDLVRAWAQDTVSAKGLFLGQSPEAASFTEIRFYSSRTPAFAPSLHITYVKRFPFGQP
jgi:hypothetical protein